MKPTLNIKSQLKKLYKSSWFITLFATTLGVLLAFYLNNLNERSKIENRKQISVQNLKKELANNKSELLNADNNDQLIDFLNAIKRIDATIPNTLSTSPSLMNELLTKYSDFIIIRDSIVIDEDQFEYHLNYKLNFELEELQNIAWETSKMSDVTNELDYNCLQILVKTYALQEIFTQEQQKVLNHFVNEEHIKVWGTILIVQQLKEQLLDAIIEAQEKVKDCN